MNKPIKSALISVFCKDGLTPIVQRMHELDIRLYSTGGTQTFIEELGIPVVPVENLTGYPSIFGGRVKTLHPGVLGGILYRRNNKQDEQEAAKYGIQAIDCVVVDLYPFEDTVAAGGTNDEIIEKIDIGGIALIRGTAKNFQDTLIIPSVNHYSELENILNEQNGETTIDQRQHFAKEAFEPASTRRTFTIAIAYGGGYLLGGAIFRRLQALAPNARMVIAHVDPLSEVPQLLL